MEPCVNSGRGMSSSQSTVNCHLHIQQAPWKSVCGDSGETLARGSASALSRQSRVRRPWCVCVLWSVRARTQECSGGQIATGRQCALGMRWTVRRLRSDKESRKVRWACIQAIGDSSRRDGLPKAAGCCRVAFGCGRFSVLLGGRSAIALRLWIGHTLPLSPSRTNPFTGRGGPSKIARPALPYTQQTRPAGPCVLTAAASPAHHPHRTAAFCSRCHRHTPIPCNYIPFAFRVTCRSPGLYQHVHVS